MFRWIWLYMLKIMLNQDLVLFLPTPRSFSDFGCTVLLTFVWDLYLCICDAGFFLGVYSMRVTPCPHVCVYTRDFPFSSSTPTFAVFQNKKRKIGIFYLEYASPKLLSVCLFVCHIGDQFNNFTDARQELFC